MPVIFTVHPCRSAMERNAAHDLERKLDLKYTGRSFWEVHGMVKSALPELKRKNEHSRALDMAMYRDGKQNPCITVFDLGRPYISVTYTEHEHA